MILCFQFAFIFPFFFKISRFVCSVHRWPFYAPYLLLISDKLGPCHYLQTGWTLATALTD